MTTDVRADSGALPIRGPRRRSWTDGERARAARLRADVERRRWVLRWVATAVGRSVSTVQQALRGDRAASVTLDRVEVLIRAVDAGQVAPEVHPERPASLVDRVGVADRVGDGSGVSVPA